MTDPTSPLMGMPVLDVPHPRRIEAKPQPARSAAADPAGPPKIALPSTKKTIVGSADDLPTSRAATPSAPKIRPAVQKTILGTAPPLAPAVDPAAPAKKTILGTGFEDEGLRPTLPDGPLNESAAPEGTPHEMRHETSTEARDEPAKAAPSALAPRARVAEVEPIQVPTTSASPAFWMLLVAICAVIAGIVYTF
jgi:hypothetical protein